MPEIRLSTTELDDALCACTKQIVAITQSIHAAQMRSDYTENTGTCHFANLLHWNIKEINKLSAELRSRI